jgi:hypothetical protein
MDVNHGEAVVVLVCVATHAALTAVGVDEQQLSTLRKELQLVATTMCSTGTRELMSCTRAATNGP